MRQIPLSSSLLVFVEDIEFTEAALSADEDTKHLACLFRDELETWEKVFKRYRDGRRAIVKADAKVSVCNQKLDDTTTRFGHVLLAEAGGDRKSTFYRRFFPMIPSEFIRQGLRKQCEYTRDTMIGELEKLPDESPLKAYLPVLEERVARTLDALDARGKVMGERASTAHDVEEWKEGVNRLRLSTYAALLQLATEKNLGKSFAESFFRSAKEQLPEGVVAVSSAIGG